MNLTIFDLDNTLLDGDSDYAWGCFLAELGVVNAEEYKTTNERFYDDYRNGRLDIYAFLAFAFEPLRNNSLENLLKWRQQFVEQHIEKMILPKAEALIADHHAKGDITLIITATNSFVTEPIARRLGIKHLLATEAEMANNAYTGKVHGIPCFQKGKISRLEQWIAEQSLHPEETCFYSDSHNDIPLLEYVHRPVAVDPDPVLREYAKNKRWDIITLR